ncbi:MAG: hypothetical protein ABEJ72_11265, partial [Candidatus Aenigmatarchaeota archaeon]
DRSWYLEEPTAEELESLLEDSDYRDIFVKSIKGDTRHLGPDVNEAYRDFLENPREVKVVNIAHARNEED